MRVLMTTGGSIHSETALWFGASMAALCDEPPTVLTVITNEDERAEAEDILERARSILKKSLPETHTTIRIGRPDEEILTEAEEGDYDLLILGERQFHSLKTRLFGSVAKRVLQNASCSILIAKGKIEAIRQILICDSGAHPTSISNRFVESDFVRLITEGVDITVLHVMSQISAGPNVSGAQLQASAQELIETETPEGTILRRDLERFTSQGIQPHMVVRHGLVTDEILAEAEAGDYDLITIGARRDEGWQRFLLDDISLQLATRVDRPILILR